MRISPQKTQIAILRIAAKMPQKEFANIANVTVSYLQKVEYGTIPPSSYLRKIASQVFGKKV